MKSIVIAAAAAVAFTGAALADGPQLLSDDQMDQVVAGYNFPDGTLLFPYVTDDGKVRFVPLMEGENAPPNGGGQVGPWKGEQLVYPSPCTWGVNCEPLS